MFLHTHDFWGRNCWLNPHGHRGGDASPHEFFSELAAEALGESGWNFAYLMRHLLQNLRRFFFTGSGQVTELWRHKSNNLRPICHRNRVFSYVTCCLWLEWRHYAWFRSELDHIWPLTLHLDVSKVIRGHWPWLTPYMPIVANLAVFGVSWGPETEHAANFSHRHVYSASWHYPTSISAIHPVCPQAILPMRVALFPSGMIYMTNIWSRYRNNMSFYSELNVERVGEDFVSIR